MFPGKVNYFDQVRDIFTDADVMPLGRKLLPSSSTLNVSSKDSFKVPTIRYPEEC